MTAFNLRSVQLKTKINAHLTKITGQPNDYYEKLSSSDIVELKNVLSDIHNLLTFKMTISAANWLSNFFKLNQIESKQLLAEIDNTSPNAKGFDIFTLKPHKIVAEVKCISPMNLGAKFGAAQRNLIIKDFNNLKNGKFPQLGTTDFYKFLFLIDLGDRSFDAMKALMKESKIRISNPEREQRNEIRKHIILLDEGASLPQLNLDKIYIQILKMD